MVPISYTIIYTCKKVRNLIKINKYLHQNSTTLHNGLAGHVTLGLLYKG